MKSIHSNELREEGVAAVSRLLRDALARLDALDLDGPAVYVATALDQLDAISPELDPPLDGAGPLATRGGDKPGRRPRA